jgi:hypothetical protein
MTALAIAPSPADLLQNPDGMRRWLAQQPPTRIVGFPASLTVCPIAEYLRAQGVLDAEVGAHCVQWGERRWPGTLLPPWASDLVNAIDRLSPYRGLTATHTRALLHATAGRAA